MLKIACVFDISSYVVRLANMTFFREVNLGTAGCCYLFISYKCCNANKCCY